MEKNNKTQKLAVCAVLAALCCVATFIIRIPSVYGYVNVGDVVVLICGWQLGKKYGFAAAGIGSALADLLAGYAVYIPATFVIKGCMAFVACILYTVIKKAHINRVLSRVISAIIAEVCMVFGYFIFESAVLGYGMGAAASIGTNALQGVVAIAPAVIIAEILLKTGVRGDFNK